MSKPKWIDQGGKKVLYIDFSSQDVPGIKAAIEEAKPVIRQQAPLSLLCLVDATATKFSLEVSDLIKEFTLHNKPYIKMTAIIGMAGIAKVVLNTAIAFTKRDNLIVKDTREDALAFLAAMG